EGLRADLTLCKAACAWAAYRGRTVVEPADVEAVAELALAHRRRPPPPPEQTPRQGNRDTNGGGETAPHPGEAGRTPAQALTFPSAGLFAARVQPEAQGNTLAGRGRATAVPRRGPRAGAVQAYEPGCTLSWAATVRAAALRCGDAGPARA